MRRRGSAVSQSSPSSSSFWYAGTTGADERALRLTANRAEQRLPHRRLDILDSLAAEPAPAGGVRAALLDRLHGFHQAAQARVQNLRDQLTMAEGFAGQIQEQVDRFAP
nr:hypothetical protein GCM10020063_043210 [Dactylosporangium thailandense]